MNDYASMAPAGVGGLICACLCACACLGTYGTLTVYFGIFALSNPDAQAWYGIVDNEQALRATADELAGSALEPFPVHDRMVSWFLWGFILNMLPFLACICSGLAATVS